MIDTVTDVIRFMAAATACDDRELMAEARKRIHVLYQDGDTDIGKPLWEMWVFLQRNLNTAEGDVDVAV